MCLDFEDHIELVVETYDPCIVFEYADAPVFLAQVAPDLLRRSKNGLLQHVVETSLATLRAVSDAASQCLVAAVFTPGLGDRFELHVGRIAIERLEVVLDGLHLDERQIELSFDGQFGERFIVHLVELELEDAQVVRDVLALAQACTDDDNIRVVILTGNGRAFCAGFDLKELGSGHSDNAAEEVLISADDALYRSKDAGKNSVTEAIVTPRVEIFKPRLAI